MESVGTFLCGDCVRAYHWWSDGPLASVKSQRAFSEHPGNTEEPREGQGTKTYLKLPVGPAAHSVGDSTGYLNLFSDEPGHVPPRPLSYLSAYFIGPVPRLPV
jgi:hypothetical protein